MLTCSIPYVKTDGETYDCPLPWLPAIHATIDSDIDSDNIPDGFLPITLSHTTRFCPQNALSWLNLLRTSPNHPFCCALRSAPSRRSCRLGSSSLDFSTPKIMGIWNVTPDSFSSACDANPASVNHARMLIEQGADILDIGAESTRPNATTISFREEIQRLEKPLTWARQHLSCPISLDSYHPETIQWALEHHLIDIVNDVAMSQLIGEREKKIYTAVKNANAALILMAWHPHDAQPKPLNACLDDIVLQLSQRLDCAWKLGLDLRHTILDPGIGFGKGLDNDLQLITHAPFALSPFARPVLIAHSRKRCLAKYSGIPQNDLDFETALTAAFAFKTGAQLVRVHRPSLSLRARVTAQTLVLPHV